MKNTNHQKTYYILIIYVFLIFISSCQSNTNSNNIEKGEIPYCHAEPMIDGLIDESWSALEWQAMDQLWVGEKPEKNDFIGKFKLMWNEDALYVLAHITDDVLEDTHSNPLNKYWDDDCLEIFIDEDASKGNHQYTHNAFAYHIALDQKVADIGTDTKPRLYPENLKSTMKDLGNNEYMWEVKVFMYKDDFIDDKINEPIKLKANQDFGFAIAYCDNDGSEEREHFMGSSKVVGEDKNRGWIDAGVFGQYILRKP